MSMTKAQPGGFWSISSWIANQVAFLLAVLAIYVAEMTHPTVSKQKLAGWITVAVANWLLRSALHRARMSLPGLGWARAISITIPAIALSQWAWAVDLFIGPAFTTTAVVMFVVFVMMSIAAMGGWISVPVDSTVYVALLWLALSTKAALTGLIDIDVLIVLNACVTVMAFILIYSLSLMRELMDRREQADQMLIALQRTNAQLEEMRSEFAATLKNRSTFFAGASHDFKQRLHAMKLMAFSTIADLPSDDKARWALGRMSDEVEELEDYIKHILEFARIEAHDMAPEVRPVQLQRLLQKIDLQFENVAAERDVGLTFRTTDIEVRTDPAMLQRMLENLVSNAVKFTSGGGGVVVAARRRRASVVLEVWDQGPGIRPEVLPKIFEAFHQDRSEASRQEGGFGLGLFLVKRFADRLELRVSVESCVGRGSVFRIELPMLRQSTPFA